MVVTGALGFARFGYAMILPAMQDDLGLTNSQMGLLASGNLIGYMAFTLIAGVLATKYGQRITVGLSMAATATALTLTGAVRSFGAALAMRTLTGIGSGGANVPTMSLCTAWFAPERRGTAAGIMAAGSGIGLISTGLLVPQLRLLYGDLGWRYAWYLLGLLTFSIAAAAYVTLRNRPAKKGATTVGGELHKHLEDYDPPEPVRWAAVYKSPALLQLGLTYFMYGFSYIIYATFFAAYLEKEAGLTPLAAGELWLLAGVLSIFSGFIWGTFSDRVGRRYGLATTYLLLATSFLLLATVKSLEGFCSSAIIFGLTAWAVPTIMAAASGDCVGPRMAPAALAFITTVFFGAGQSMAPYVAGYMKDATGTFAPAFLLAAAAATVGAILALLPRKPCKPSEQ
ncbi:MAG: MFS transporter [Candidatus Bathyarchaeia archaeon]